MFSEDYVYMCFYLYGGSIELRPFFTIEFGTIFISIFWHKIIFGTYLGHIHAVTYVWSQDFLLYFLLLWETL